MQQDFLMDKGAIFSPCNKYRYKLWRIWGKGEVVAFVGLNPSTADENEDDPTVRRCINFAKTWGFDGLIMLNIFGYRSTDPNGLKAVDDPIGPGNDQALIDGSKQAGITIAAWGSHGGYLDRGRKALKFLTDLHYLKLTQGGFPNHPLYLKADLKPIPWRDY